MLTERDKKTLIGVDPRLVKIVVRAAEIYAPQKFIVLEGLRSKERQAELLKQKKTRTLNSQHIVGRAVDTAPLTGKLIDWENWDKFQDVATCMMDAAKEFNIPLQWGADWDMDGLTAKQGDKDEKFIDGPHYQLLPGK